MSNENMYFDPSSFDFTQLVDVVEHTAPQEKALPKLSEVGPDGGAIEDISDLADLITDEDETTATELDPNQDTSDLQSAPEVDTDKITIFNDLPEDAPLLFDGVELSKKQVKELLNSKEEFENQKDIVATAANSIDQIHRYIKQNHAAHALSIDTNIANIQRKMNSGISATEYGEEARKLTQALEARQMLNNRVDEEMKLLDVQQAEVTRFRLLQMQNAMRAKQPQWDQIQGGLWADLQSRGINLNELEKVITPELASDLLDGYRYRKQKEKAGAAALEAAKAKAPRSTSTAANAQRTKALDAQAAQKAALLKKQRNGGLTQAENAKLFDFLVD
ncbi:TPA: hypothetical protein SI878_004407 [Salmonella enterica]|nr:hypothetical protein [Salmonella enterica]